jgi:Tfp pilus assembly protein PilE
MIRSRSHFHSRFEFLRTQAGFTMIVVLGVMLVTSLLLVAAFTAANGEVRLTSLDRAQKKAYYAAEAGVEDYEYHLTQDGNYLSYCTSPPSENPALNQVPETSHRATVPSTSGEPTNEQYAIQLLPAESDKLVGDHKCDPNHLVETMIEEEGSATGTFRIESTGYSGGEERTLVATFRNANFVSYVWYTKYETGDPVIYGEPPTTPTALPNYYNECGAFYGTRPGQERLKLAGFEYPLRCAENLFKSGESVNGPMHTGDHAGICGSPVFGRNENDRIEFGNGGKPEGEGYSNEGVCGEASTPVFKGKHILPKETLSIEPPPGDEELKHIVEPSYLYEEKTEIILEGSTMTVFKHKGAGAGVEKEEKNVAYPPNGVIYVSGGCGQKYSPFGPIPRYAGNEVAAESDTTCGNVYVHGEYTKSLTIAAENDVIINGNITTPVNGEGTPTTNALLGLIANNFVRIYHPVVETYEGKAPELETAVHKEIIKVEAKSPKLGKELQVEVKEVGAEFEVIVLNEKGVALQEIKNLKKAEELKGYASSYVVYKEGAKYSEGKAEKLTPTVAGKWLDEKCNQYNIAAESTTVTEKFNSNVRMCEYTDKGLFACDAPNSSKDLKEPTIYAAMLAVKHGVIVDNFSCGKPELGSLKVYGAVAGLYTNGYSGSEYPPEGFHGYPYDAIYDNRLQAEEPPHFLNPIEAAWYVQRQSVAPNP